MTVPVPRFEALVPVANFEHTVDFGGGSQAVSLTSARYFFLASHGRITSAATSATLTCSAGHGLVAGDVVTVWDISAAAALVTGAVVQSVTATTVVIDSSITVAVGDRVYAENDVLGLWESRLADADTANGSDNVRVAMSTTTGLVSMSMSTGTSTVTWGAGGTTFRDLARYSGSTLALSTSAQTGARAHFGGFYPSKAVVDERDPTRRIRQVYEGDDDQSVRIFSVAKKRRLLVRVRFLGTPRDTTWNERDDFEDFVDHVAQGYPLRLYPDRTVFEAYVRNTTPYGYETWVTLRPDGFDPQELIRRQKEIWEETLELALAA